MKYVVVYGDLQSGLKEIHGPFDSVDEAVTWAELHDFATGGNGDDPYVVRVLRRAG